MSINKATISGHLGGDPELRSTATGRSVLTFNVAVNERVPDGNNGWTDRANWIKVTVWGNRADSLARILSKGSKVAVSGRLRQEKWERNGETRSTVGIVADEIDLMSARSDADNGYRPPASEVVAEDAPTGVYDADIPF